MNPSWSPLGQLPLAAAAAAVGLEGGDGDDDGEDAVAAALWLRSASPDRAMTMMAPPQQSWLLPLPPQPQQQQQQQQVPQLQQDAHQGRPSSPRAPTATATAPSATATAPTTAPPPPFNTKRGQSAAPTTTTTATTTTARPPCMNARRRLELLQLEQRAAELERALASEQARHAQLRRECASRAHMADALASLVRPSPAALGGRPLLLARPPPQDAVVAAEAVEADAADPPATTATATTATATSEVPAVYDTPAFVSSLQRSFSRVRLAAEQVHGINGGGRDGRDSGKNKAGGPRRKKGGPAAAAAAPPAAALLDPASAAAFVAGELAAKVASLLLASAADEDGGSSGGAKTTTTTNPEPPPPRRRPRGRPPKPRPAPAPTPAPAAVVPVVPPAPIFAQDERDRRIFEASAMGQLLRAEEEEAEEEWRRQQQQRAGSTGNGSGDGAAAAGGAAAASAGQGSGRGGRRAGSQSTSSGLNASAATTTTATATTGSTSTSTSGGISRWDARCAEARRMDLPRACELLVGIKRISLAFDMLAAAEADEEGEGGNKAMEAEEVEVAAPDDGPAAAAAPAPPPNPNPTSVEAARQQVRQAALDLMSWMGALVQANSTLAERLNESNLVTGCEDAALAGDLLATRRRARRALEAAKPDREQVELMADAYRLFKEGSSGALQEWRVAAQGLEGNDPKAALERLDSAVASSFKARSMMALVALRVLRLEQVAAVALAFHPSAMRTMPLSEAAFEMAREKGWA